VIEKNTVLDDNEKIMDQKLVVKISMGYNNMYHNILDLIQEGKVGLLHAVKKYNPYKGNKFSTYAQFWIRAYIMRFIMDVEHCKTGDHSGPEKTFLPTE